MEHTHRRAGGVYTYRRRIPHDLVEQYGKREVTFSLRTKDYPEAKREAARATVRLDDEWAAARRTLPKPDTGSSMDYDLIEVAGMVLKVPPPPGGWPAPWHSGLTDEELLRAEREQEEEMEQHRRLHPDEWHADAPGTLETFEPSLRAAVEEVMAQKQMAEQLASLAPEVRALVEATLLKRGKLAATQASGVSFPAPAPTPIPAKKTSLDTLVGHWKRERSVNSKTVSKMERAVLEFNLFHKDPAVESITRAMVIAYRSHLLGRVSANGRGLSKGTIDDRLSSIGTLLQLAYDHGIVLQNVAAKTALPTNKLATKARIGYTAQQAELVMTGTEEYRKTHPARFWLPRLARWTGARLNELHQLRRQDLVERDGIRGINIIDEGEHAKGIPMRMKNAASRRWVPLHAALSEFWTWAQGRPPGALFPAKPDKHGSVSTEFSKWYGRTLRGKWGIADDRVTFHSWRHAFADSCRAAHVQDSHRYALMGHAEGGAAGGYGSGGLPPAVLLEAIRKIGQVGVN